MTDEVVKPENAPVVLAPKEREPTSYEIELRREAQKHRLAKQEAEKEFEAKAAAWKADTEKAIADVRKEAQDRLIRAELKSAAIKAGMVDLDGLKLLDISGVKLTDTGELDGADALMAKAKEAKPYLFGTGNTSHTGDPPTKKAPAPKSAVDMTPEEYQAAKKAAISRR